ncbi:hypothetical protein niasHT_015660 [Heterodera trifolii]|uniref:ILCR1 Ig-like domain-containing protein n=1 Tax=Heterodera trifolii TaxID=157864 RepID=A0ABD2L4B3_9BILA
MRRLFSFSLRFLIIKLIAFLFSIPFVSAYTETKLQNELRNGSLISSSSSSSSSNLSSFSSSLSTPNVPFFQILHFASNGTFPSSSNTSSVNSSHFVFFPFSVPIFGVPGATASIDCSSTDQLISSSRSTQSIRWECAIKEEKAERNERGENWEDGGGEGHSQSAGWGQFAPQQQRQFRSGPIELYHSHKVNQSDGKMFISALVRWHFLPLIPKYFYRIHFWIRQNGSSISDDGVQKEIRHFVVHLAASDSNRSFEDKTNEHGIMTKAALFLHIDAFFEFGNSYEILCSAEKINRFQKENDTMERSILLGNAYKSIAFQKMYDEMDMDGCPDGRGIMPNPKTSAEALAKRREMASRWTGALRSVSFFPWHSAVNVSFFAAPPSHCIGNYRVQIWLMNALHNETSVTSQQLSRIGPNVYIGSAEFRELPTDERMKYQLKVVPEEQSNGICICEMNRKCGCVQVHSEPFSLLLPNSSSADQSDFVSLLRPSVPFFSVPSPSSHSFALPPLLLACLFLSLTLILLAIILLLLILRRSADQSTERKRRILFIFTGKQKNVEEFGLMRRKEFGVNFSLNGSQKKLESILLVNAQPNRRNELERVARVLVKNGIRVFYDRWDRESIERNLLGWVQNAVTKATKIVLFYDSRAEQLLLVPSAGQNGDLFDRVFCALYQHLDPQKTIFIKWDESKLADGRPLAAFLLAENVFLFRRDLKQIFAAFNVTISDTEQRDIEREYEKVKMIGNPNEMREEKPNERTHLLSEFEDEHMAKNNGGGQFGTKETVTAPTAEGGKGGEGTEARSNCNTTTAAQLEWHNEAEEQRTKKQLAKGKEEDDSGVIVP